jgi:hypothetical protein
MPSFTGWYWLKTRINDPARQDAIKQYVFHGATSNAWTLFTRYLQRGEGPEFYDGPKSTVDPSHAQCEDVGDRSVQNFFKRYNDPTICTVGALTCRLSPVDPLKTFFEPRVINYNQAVRSDENVALLFHEALHGFLLLNDEDLQSQLGCTRGFANSRDITLYLEQFVGAQPLQGPPVSCMVLESGITITNPPENLCPSGLL